MKFWGHVDVLEDDRDGTMAYRVVRFLKVHQDCFCFLTDQVVQDQDVIIDQTSWDESNLKVGN